ncbi:S-adenosyl-L-methionine-dependent methyltransferase [Tricharina praecox]|uniref:S-adenosyl-L-methionine-dependent methyltransferase n=1 Tax=Tricharina praecox TaxID=43433 RepID=UPI002220B746|nr:S-adenosyl-L-methionine-dependent methyltransferase [Tricharina praecox]KAI5853612.1 S-adenosyl-L-methionine-dependent methyltransferase [Tricharina praecox]
MTTAESTAAPPGIVSTFLTVPSTIVASSAPTIIHLKRDNNQALALSPTSTLQTRFGTFPHTSFLSLSPGSQVRASATHPNPRDQRKRKRASPEEISDAAAAAPSASGFVHVLAPTAELWTASLPHRTQVVYTPDSSYILHRLNVGPGSRVIEAGAGSGSFTHAAVRAVWSFEFHEERAGKLREEIANHNLDGLVQITHKDVCAEGFLVPSSQLQPALERSSSSSSSEAVISPLGTAVFLDLPAPWLAIPHLSRTAASPLDPAEEVRICTFSPCIEQVTRTCAALRTHGWVDVQTVELSHQRLEVRRQLPRGYDDGAGPRSISEALTRLRGVNNFREQRKDLQVSHAAGEKPSFEALGFKKASGRKNWGTGEEGRVVSRCEPEIKTHTSFLTFATLPREWTDEMEAQAAAWVAANETRGVIRGVVGEKEKKWQGERAESNRSKKRKEREARKMAGGEGDSVNGDSEAATAAAKNEDMEIDG